MSALQALYALFRENEIPMSDRNGGLHDIISAALAEAEKVEPEVLVRNEREDHFRIWESAGAWLYPGDCIAVLRAAGGEG